MASTDDYSDEIANIICERIAVGETLLNILKDEHMPIRLAVHGWLDTNPEFCRKYELAEKARAFKYMDDIAALTAARNAEIRKRGQGQAYDKAIIVRGKLQIDALQFLVDRELSPQAQRAHKAKRTRSGE